MRRKLIVIVFAGGILLCAAFVILAVANARLSAELRRVEANYQGLASGDGAQQQTLTVGELKECFGDYVDELKQYGVKAKNVENIVRVEYRIRDTTVVHVQTVYVFDTIREEYYREFDVRTDCFHVSGDVCDTFVTINEIGVEDEITMAIFREKRKCLFGRQKVTAVAISSCSGDTLKVLRNIAVQGRRTKR